MRLATLITVSFMVLCPACGGGGEVGDTCETPASEDECVDGAVCDSKEDGTVECLQLCTDASECRADEDCNGLSDGSDRKACHPKDLAGSDQ